MPKVHYGTPSLDECRGKWKLSRLAPRFNSKQFDRAYEQFTEQLEQIGKVGFSEREGCDFYIRGDNYANDYTHYLEIINPEKLTSAFLREIQSWLTGKHFKWHRIFVITYLSAATPVVYADQIRLGVGFCTDLENGLEKIRRQMRSGFAFSSNTYLVDSNAAQQISEISPADQREEIKSMEGQKMYAPAHWICSWGLANVASQVYSDLRQSLPEQLRECWDLLLGQLFWNKSSKWDDFEPSMLLIHLDPKQAGEMSLLAHSLSVDLLQPGFEATCKIEKDRYMSQFEEFRNYLEDWKTLLDIAFAGKLGIMTFAS